MHYCNREYIFRCSCHVLIITSDMSPYKEEAVIALFTVYGIAILFENNFIEETWKCQSMSTAYSFVNICKHATVNL